MIDQKILQQLVRLRTSIKQMEAEEAQLERRIAGMLRDNDDQEPGTYRATLSTFRMKRMAWRAVVVELKNEEWAKEVLQKRGTAVRFSRVVFSQNGKRRKQHTV